jgi:hypothetical protein
LNNSKLKINKQHAILAKPKMEMKKILLFAIPVILFSGFSSSYKYTPVIMTRAELEKSVSMLEARNPASMSKIYVKDNYLLVTEKYKGVHIYNNSDPSNPKPIGFLRVPGCSDVAMKGSILYVDNAVDIVAVDLSKNPAQVVSRLASTLPELLPPGSDYIPSDFAAANRPQNTIIVEWKKNYNYQSDSSNE